MTNTNYRYETFKSRYAGYDWEVVRVEGIDYYPISRLPKDPTGLMGFPVRQDEPTKSLKRLLGKAFTSDKILTKLNSRSVDCISQETLNLAVAAYFKKDCGFAQSVVMAAFETTQRLANDVSLGTVEKAEYYSQWMEERCASKIQRRACTDYLQMCEDSGIEVNYAFFTIEVYRYAGLLEKYYAWKLLYETEAQRRKNPFRDSLNQLELRELTSLEGLIAKVGTKRELSPQATIVWISENI